MFFLTRCTFWLGVVAWQLPWPGLAPADLQAGIKTLDAKAVLTNIDALCSASPAICTEAAKRAVAALSAAPAARPAVKPASAPAAVTAPTRAVVAPDPKSPPRRLARSDSAQRRPEPPG